MNRVFGIDLDAVLARENRPIPMVIQKCCEAIEAYGALTPTNSDGQD